MTLTRATKARVLRFLNPRRLVVLTMALGLVAGAYHLVSLVGLFWGFHLPTAFIGFLFMGVLPIHAFRWWALAQGWSAVTVHEAKLANLAEQVGQDLGAEEDGQASGQALEFQKRLTAQIERLGWVSWRDVLDVANAVGWPLQKVASPMFLGGNGPVARRSHWHTVLQGAAHKAGKLEARLAAVEATPVRKQRL